MSETSDGALFHEKDERSKPLTTVSAYCSSYKLTQTQDNVVREIVHFGAY